LGQLRKSLGFDLSAGASGVNSKRLLHQIVLGAISIQHFEELAAALCAPVTFSR
jgi:hypothetical protein